MRQQNTVSLQSKLINTSVSSSIVAGLIAFVLLMAMTVYQTMHVHDEIMDEVSDMLLISDLSASSGQQMDELSDEFDIEYQLIMNKQLLTQSPEFSPQFVQVKKQYFRNQKGYSYIWLNHTLMRMYQFQQGDQQVLLYQPFRERFKEVVQSVFGYAFILLVLWVVQWAILRYTVRRQFHSIHQLSKAISAKSADDLTPIQQHQPEFQELQPMVAQLNQLLSRLEHSLEAEQRFTADASHELRSPLSAIQMRLQLLKRKYGQAVPHLDQDLNQIQTDVARGTQVLENLLLLARLDPSQTTQLPHSHFDVAQTIKDALKSLQPFVQEKQLQIETQFAEADMDANQELIFTCIRNVIDNAIRYTPLEGQVRIDLSIQAEQLCFEIENSGHGLDSDVIQRLGERFYRQLGTKTQGSGLGLSICKRILQLHQGSIHFSASDLGGLKVQMHLPLSQMSTTLQL